MNAPSSTGGTRTHEAGDCPLVSIEKLIILPASMRAEMEFWISCPGVCLNPAEVKNPARVGVSH